MLYKSSGVFWKKRLLGSIALLFFILFTGCEPLESDTQTHKSDGDKRIVASEAMVSSAHPLASEAGLKMLKAGGNAVDAAVATAFALNVVEPNMSGIGGGGSMLIWEQEKEEANYVDFYTAKRAASYKDVDYDQFEDDEFNLLSTGVPGTVDGLLQALERHGTMSREEVMEPAIKYATEGFPIYLTLAQFIRDNEEKLKRFEGASDVFWPDGEPLDVGSILKQPELSETLQQISDEGPSAFYEGQNAEEMVEVLNEEGNPVMIEDFAEYEPQWNKPPLCSSYKDYTVLSAPLPQTGFYILQGLNILENYNFKKLGLPTESKEAFDILSSVMRLSIADRVEYVTDPNWQDVPVNGLVSKEYANKRSELIGLDTVPEEITYGDPSAISSAQVSPDCDDIGRKSRSKITNFDHSNSKTKAFASRSASYNSSDVEESGETTHISIVDPDGNAVSLSTTLSHVFGSGAWVNGFILNNSGYDFSEFEDEEEWESDHPYRIRASTISPTIILDDKKVRLVVGAPGGGRIPTAILQNILYVLDYGLDPIDAVKMPRIFPSSSNPEVQIEKGFDNDILVELRNMGYDIQALSKGYARLYLISNEDGKLIGVSDPRHDGEPRGF